MIVITKLTSNSKRNIWSTFCHQGNLDYQNSATESDNTFDPGSFHNNSMRLTFTQMCSDNRGRTANWFLCPVWSLVSMPLKSFVFLCLVELCSVQAFSVVLATLLYFHLFLIRWQPLPRHIARLQPRSYCAGACSVAVQFSSGLYAKQDCRRTPASSTLSWLGKCCHCNPHSSGCCSWL